MLEISPIHAFDDNFIWLLRKPGYNGCVVVDPGDEEPVIDLLKAQNLTLDAILVTHKHGDHVGGLEALKAYAPDTIIYGPKDEPIKHLDVELVGGQEVVLEGLETTFIVMDVPGHTEGHIAYYGENSLFCGDTIFAGGCGRVFSGTHEQLSKSLQAIGGLPADTQLYCAHEYTLVNLGFALLVEPENPALLKRIKADEAKREKNLPTVPSSVQLELQTNPFMRTDVVMVIKAAEKWRGGSLMGPDAVFHALRDWKDKDYD